MSERGDVEERLAEYLELELDDPALETIVTAFWRVRDDLLDRFPFLLIMMGVSEADNASNAATVIEAVLYDVHWVEMFRKDRSTVEQCRSKLSTLLRLLSDESFVYVHDPNLAAWCVMNTLAVEVTARSGLGSLFGSKDRDMVQRVLADAVSHWEAKRGLPRDMETRLRALEGQGVMLPSDIYQAVEKSRGKPKQS